MRIVVVDRELQPIIATLGSVRGRPTSRARAPPPQAVRTGASPSQPPRAPPFLAPASSEFSLEHATPRARRLPTAASYARRQGSLSIEMPGGRPAGSGKAQRQQRTAAANAARKNKTTGADATSPTDATRGCSGPLDTPLHHADRSARMRLTDAEILAARRAGFPPVKKEDCAHPLDDWHAAQESWLERWRPAAVLPGPKEKRRRAWDDLVKMHARHCKVRTSSPPHAVQHRRYHTALAATRCHALQRARSAWLLP